ncbi:acetyl-CoA carboxylase biotin carboxylase subunit [Neobacillus citreus]|nr:acetyl-CoA carboxylase biotin carboxylase subunit [Neobacillus citreus]MCH6267971.1 acetyl-CoA carboxylase biotin carboxylase subunit [Neobacillus citreus]
MNRVLVANRGEIAVRIIRACKELGIETIAVYSDADQDGLHVHLADKSVSIGPAPSRKSYLNIEKLISVAIEERIDAIHPGYGFLAENDEFSDACARNHICFIGPSGDIIRKMGNKIQARKAAVEAGVPVVPGTNEKNSDVEEFARAAHEIGYPVLLKAAAAGGGRGMKVVFDERELRNFYQQTQAEAAAAFGDGTVYIEKYIQNARHVEVQVLFDHYGNGIHLGERDCSIQRRHQKLIEEAPSPVLDSKMREEMHAAALALAKSQNYTSAGTIEFVVDADSRKFYFIEMNTRVQVEHPVTEMLTGIDIVKEQLRIAEGHKLSIEQRDVQFMGHAIECRINAEDPFRGFMPMPGKIEHLHLPGGTGVRVDSHCYAGYSIPLYYDSLLGKLIVHGQDREEAIVRMLRALGEIDLKGIRTTVPFHERVLGNPDFRSGKYNTRWVEESFLHELNKPVEV